MTVIIAASGLGRIHRGCERFFLDLARRLRAAGQDVECWGGAATPEITGLPLAPRQDLLAFADRVLNGGGSRGASAEELRQWSGDAEEYLFAFTAARALREALAGPTPILLYLRYWQLAIHGGNPELIAACAAGIRSGRATVVVHGDHVYPHIARGLGAMGIVYHAITPMVAAELRELRFPESQIFEAWLGMEEGAWAGCRRLRAAARRELGISERAFVVASVGALDDPVKRHEYLLDEILRMPPDERPYWLVAGHCGTPPPWAYRAQRELGDRVRLLANVQFAHMPAVYGAADLFAMAGNAEGCALVYLEAQLAGLPCLFHDYDVTRFVCAGLDAELLGLTLADLTRPGTGGAAVTAWRERMLATGSPQLRLDAFAQCQAERFGWRSLVPRYVEGFRRLAPTDSTRLPAVAGVSR